MTLSSTSAITDPQEGNGSNSSFPFSFKIFQSSDIEVIKTSALGVETTLVLDSHYSVSVNSDQESSPGGTVTYPISGTKLAAGEYLTIARALAYSQELDLPAAGGSFSPNNLEDALDRIVMLVQQIKAINARVLQLPVSAVGTVSAALPAPSANARLAWDATGTSLTNVEDEGGGMISASTFVTDNILPAANGAAILVAIGGTSAADALSATINYANAQDAVTLGLAEDYTDTVVGALGITGVGYRQTPIDLTSDTEFDLSSIADIQRIEVAFYNITTSVTTPPTLRIGTGGAVDTGSGYDSTMFEGLYKKTYSITGGFPICPIQSKGIAIQPITGTAMLTHLGGNVWVFSTTVMMDSGVFIGFASGSVTLSGALDILDLYARSGGAFLSGDVSVTAYT